MNLIKITVILLMFGILVNGSINQPTDDVKQKLSDFKVNYDEKKEHDFNVADFEILNIRKEAQKSLSNVKVVIVYDRVTDGDMIGRSMNDTISIFKETGIDFIFRGFSRFHPIPESQNDSNGFFTDEQLTQANETGYTYEDLKKSINSIKKEKPDVIFCGGIGAQWIHAKKDRNPITGEIIGKNKTWEMALDPIKWGINMSKEEFLSKLSKKDAGYGINGPFFYPDITNPKFQELLLSWADKQIDSGVDAIWIDLLYKQAEMFETYAKKHPDESEKARKASKESYDAASKIIDEIHNYSLSKGKYIYVGTEIHSLMFLPYTLPELDFATEGISPIEVLSMNFNDNKWDNIANSKLGNISIFAILDWNSGSKSGLGVFSQNLSIDQKKDFLIKADYYFQRKGINFVYPVHGGFMGKEAKKLSFGKWKIYDSKAPEFDTYNTIKELAQNKSRDRI